MCEVDNGKFRGTENSSNFKFENNAKFDESDPEITFRVDSSIIERIRQFFDELEF